jgi:hypothetical protein
MNIDELAKKHASKLLEYILEYVAADPEGPTVMHAFFEGLFRDAMQDALTQLVEAPTPTGRTDHIAVTGFFIPYVDGAPVLLQIAGAAGLVLPIFSRADFYEDGVNDFDLKPTACKRIENSREFFDSIPPDVTVVSNPHRLASGRVRYLVVSKPCA